jgi:hypothetical protein
MNVVFIIFNRPCQTRRVAEAIARAKPDRLLVVSDGPRVNRPDDRAKIAETRAVIESINWPCEVSRNYSEVNLGCRKRVTSGLDWAFSLVDEAIILEDDLLPDPSFFPYCMELLERYRTEERVAYIGGYQFFPELACVPDSYYFSIYGGIWGWATWRRAWRLHDDAMSEWPALKISGWTKRVFPDAYVAKFFEKTWDSMKAGFDAWGYRWYFTIRRNDMFCIMPRVNLIENIGFGEDATHTTDLPPAYLSRKASRMSLPMIHPAKISGNHQADRLIADIGIPRPLGYFKKILKILVNKHLYGRYLRRVPILGRFWDILRW